MDSQQQYKSSEKTSELIQEGIKKWLIKYHIGQLDDLLNRIAKKVQEKVNLTEIGEYFTTTDLRCNKHDNNSIWCGYYIKAYLYNKDENKVIVCYSDTKNLPYKIKCTNYNNRSFELSDSKQSISFLEGIKNSILNIYNKLNPEGFTYMDERYIRIITNVSMDLYKPIKENPEIEISKDNNVFRYNNGRSNILMSWRMVNPPKL